MPTTCATGSGLSPEYNATSPKANDFPTFNNRHTPMTSLSDDGFLRKLIVRPVVTASGTNPISLKMTTYRAKSATVISTGPDTVPTGRNSSLCLMVADQSPNASTIHLFEEIQLSKRRFISSFDTTISLLNGYRLRHERFLRLDFQTTFWMINRCLYFFL